ncbi:DUF1999 domain-containing protein [Deinococcus maricopensis]|uniref:DUF1999 domain-containing protein n=1 Tax=Deinococcus maricopensis (strain DSM 21211 / LMG 22137 / NRRL B-23946 / LB-34) TaxID=709986 RepID=E8UBF9_DEIML|nr:DUF1999 domain-containing protein [Deinococcus maricopensis]ADV68398.1 Protein of unknown function DUF1999 [Deinococcus maricopensis DSM 21211]
MEYRTFHEPDFDALQALEARVLRAEDPNFDALAEREREGRVRTSLAALKFFERSEHSFAAAEGGTLHGVILAQSVWQGDRPIVLVARALIAPDAPADTAAGLLRACVKSAYDAAVYEVHFPLTDGLEDAARADGAYVTGQYAVRHLGTRAETAPGARLGGAPNAGA